MNNMVAAIFSRSSRRLFSAPKMIKKFPNDLRFNWTPPEIHDQAHAIMSHAKEVLDSIASFDRSSVSASILTDLNTMHRRIMTQQSSIDFLQNVSTNREVREASREADKTLSDFWVEMSMRKDVFDKLCELHEDVIQSSSLSPEEARFLRDEILDGRRNGLHLEQGVRSEIEAIKKEISKLSIDFSTNIAEDKSFSEFTRDELEGCQADFIDSLEKSLTDSVEKFKVTLQYPHYIPLMRDCIVRDTRRVMEFKYNSRCMDSNLSILAKIVQLRDKKAKLLGYKNHADYILEKRMAKDSKNVRNFLDKLVAKISDVGIADKDKMLLKKYRLESMNIPIDSPFENCDTAFLRNLVEKNEFNVDHPAIQKYFPIQHVTEQMLSIYSDLLDLDFERSTNEPVWHDDVLCYRVSDRTDGHPVGIFYFDPYPREGKFSHAALFPLQPYIANTQIGICSLVCNFTKPTSSNPSLLTHDEVTTLFHEFGHCMHHLCAEKVTMVSFAGTSVERDFVECPSQMLENWCWEPSVLKRMSKHIETGEPLSDELIQQLVKSRNANEGIGAQRQIAFALFDQILHSGQSDDITPEYITKLYHEVYAKVTGFTPTKGTSMPASFGHLCGYDAQYYGYLWAEVFSADLYVSKFSAGNNQFSTQAGLEYREKVLGPGGSIDAADILKEYLGRDPNMDAFFELKGMTTTNVQNDGKL